jgi:hypothetical protein
MTGSDAAANAQALERIKAWFARCDSATADTALVPSASVAAALGPLTGALGTDAAVVSNAQLTGDVIAEVIKKSQRLKELMASGDPVQGLEYFKTTPMDGCTSILDMARRRSGYAPMNPNAGENLKRFRDYATLVLDAPVFVKKIFDSRPLSWNAGSWNKSVAKAISLFPGIRPQDVAKIRDGLMALARAAASRSGSVQSGTFFVQNILQANDFSVYMYYAYASLREIQRKKKSTVRETRLTIARAQLAFLVSAWPAYAEQVWNRHVCAVVDWLESNSTRPGDDAAALCFDT